jgi:hypothetical protein
VLARPEALLFQARAGPVIEENAGAERVNAKAAGNSARRDSVFVFISGSGKKLNGCSVHFCDTLESYFVP